jgi:hypothetical protein
MTSIRARVVGFMAALMLVGAVVVPMAASGSTPPENTQTTAESTVGSSAAVQPAVEEACPYGDVCVWPQFRYQGTRGLTICSNTGEHFFGNVKNSLKNRCPNQKVWWYEAGGGPYRCVNPNENVEVMDQEYIEVGAEGSRC